MYLLWKGRYTLDICYFKHGFPPNFKFNKPKNAVDINNACVKSGDSFDQEEILPVATSKEPSSLFSLEEMVQIAAMI